jgi:hypothetical protein
LCNAKIPLGRIMFSPHVHSACCTAVRLYSKHCGKLCGRLEAASQIARCKSQAAQRAAATRTHTHTPSRQSDASRDLVETGWATPAGRVLGNALRPAQSPRPAHSQPIFSYPPPRPNGLKVAPYPPHALVKSSIEASIDRARLALRRKRKLGWPPQRDAVENYVSRTCE